MQYFFYSYYIQVLLIDYHFKLSVMHTRRRQNYEKIGISLNSGEIFPLYMLL
jgi:hypothetical protein